LADPDGLGGSGQAALPIDLDQQAHPSGVPDFREQRHRLSPQTIRSIVDFV
jgi:hypothetical protein